MLYSTIYSSFIFLAMNGRLYWLLLLLTLTHPDVSAQAQTLPSRLPQPLALPDTIAAPLTLRIICASSVSPGNEPLWVVDGRLVHTSRVKEIAPGNITKIRVLKGTQATAIYGFQAIHGAILVTTRRAASHYKKRPVN
jgi:TonB-dependent SusC/RagA subfamily outer membrane receptor